MERLIKLGEVTAKKSTEIKESKFGLGFEKLDRDAFDPAPCYEKIENLGVKWARIQSGWQKTETEKGVYHFEWLDRIVDDLISHGLKPWICLCYGNKLYSELGKKLFGAVGVPPVFTEEEKTSWINYVKAVTKHYKGKVDTYEIWNEPDGVWCWKTGVSGTEYGIFAKETTAAIKSVDPDAYVIGGVVCLQSLHFLSEAFDAGMGEGLDGISFHEYTAREEGVGIRVSSLRGLCEQKGYKNIEIIQGESGSQSKSIGCGALSGGAWTPRKQAKQLLRHAIADLSANVKFTSYFSCMDMLEGLNGLVGDKNSYFDFGYFGVLGAEFDEEGHPTGEYKPKPSYRALQVLCSTLSDASIANVPVILLPEDSPRIFGRDLACSDVTYQGFRKENGSWAYAFYSPTYIMTTEFESTVTLEAVFDGSPEDVRLIDMYDGSVYKIPESMTTLEDHGCIKIKNLPIKDYPMLLTFGDF